jgi:hypothetical protein
MTVSNVEINALSPKAFVQRWVESRFLWLPVDHSHVYVQVLLRVLSLAFVDCAMVLGLLCLASYFIFSMSILKRRTKLRHPFYRRTCRNKLTNQLMAYWASLTRSDQQTCCYCQHSSSCITRLSTYKIMCLFVKDWDNGWSTEIKDVLYPLYTSFENIVGWQPLH